MFITIDGGDGCGKTTQQKRLHDWLIQQDREVVLCRDPGGTILGNMIRKIVLHGGNTVDNTFDNTAGNIAGNTASNADKEKRSVQVVGDGLDGVECICDIAEMLLFMASRAELVSEVIRPAIELGKDVISDRFLISNIVYQGYAGGLPIDVIEMVGQVAVSGLLPDVGIILDVPYEVGIKRISNREKDRMEEKGEAYHKRVRNGFLEYAKNNSRYIVINADQDQDIVETEIREVIQKKLLTS
ncbi:MAG: dTMP kinase [Planctomycetaceae bacterium]|jgi:dTMP kinase|nr:dTMP kinase [Planctomycetaceae bacterium]